MMKEPRTKPWEVGVVLSLVPGLWGLAVFGSAIVVWTGGTWIGVGVGGTMVIVAAAIAHHLVPRPPKLASGADPLRGLRG